MAERVVFLRPDAERIARAVRRVEALRETPPLRFRTVDSFSGKTLRLGTFTGDWQINQSKVVTFYGVTSTPNTATVLNLCNPSVGFSTASTAEERFVVFGKARGTTDLVVVELQQTGTATCVMTLGGTDLSALPGYAGDEIQVLGHNESACLQWYSITTCGTSTASV